jgi:hypothetical protein
LENVNFLAYRNAVRQVWKDGKITSSELETLETVRKSLNISMQEHDDIEIEVKNELEAQGIKFEKPVIPQSSTTEPPNTTAIEHQPLDDVETDEIFTYFNQGKTAYDKKQFDIAVEYFDKVLSIDPENDRAVFYKKRSLSKIPKTITAAELEPEPKPEPEHETVESTIDSSTNVLTIENSPPNNISNNPGNPSIESGNKNLVNMSAETVTTKPIQSTNDSTSVLESIPEPLSHSIPAEGSGGDPNCTSCEGTGECRWCNSSGKCNWCSGLGNCKKCGATGKIDGEDCSSCKGTGECFSCKGTGNCFWCKGTGKCSKCNS